MIRRDSTASLLLAAALLSGCAAWPERAPAPLSADEHHALGVAYYRRGDYEAAARAFGRALALQPGLTRALVNLGDARLAQGALEPALEAYERALAADPDDPALANNLAWALLQHETRWSEAEPLIRRALARGPEPRGYYLDTLGFLMLRQGNAEQALDTFRAALTDPGLRDPDARRLVLRHAAEALARLGDQAGAERCLGLAGAGTNVGGRDTMC